MKTVKGIFAEAKIFTDDVEDYAQALVKMICDNEIVDGSTICMMPDIHPGKIAPIGLSMTVTDKVIPQLLGHLLMIFDAKWQNFCVRKIPMPMPVQAQGS